MSSPNPTFTNLNPNNPLTGAHLTDINTALRALDQAEAQATQGIQAGFDFSAQLDQIKAQRAQLLKIKNVYFPGQ